jgi:hypothetical protein
LKTVLIYDQCGQAPLRFYVLGEDYRHLHGTYINSDSNDNLQDELSALLGLADYPDSRPHLDVFPVDAVKEGAAVIVCGFYP